MNGTFAARLGIDYALAVCSGTAALHIAFASLGLTCGDEVLVPAFYYVATAHAILATGGDSGLCRGGRIPGDGPGGPAPENFPRTKAIVPVHMRGVPSNITAISAIAKEHGLLLIEDCAQSCGATFQGQHVGTFRGCSGL